jgi:D-alanyl-D-alanine carboxypeptidase/D-alanyl-D-alanine-endopeptidase (penicillin-binding protein 4)
VTTVDGSGLSETNFLTCAAVAELLAQNGPDSALGRSLAIGGELGSLETRFVDAPAAGFVLAKTGTLLNVRALSGYVLSDVPDAPGQYLTFAQIANDNEVTELVETVQEPLVNSLVLFPPGATVEELSPAPAADIN